jgi:hypothetical protein
LAALPYSAAAMEREAGDAGVWRRGAAVATTCGFRERMHKPDTSTRRCIEYITQCTYMYRPLMPVFKDIHLSCAVTVTVIAAVIIAAAVAAAVAVGIPGAVPRTSRLVLSLPHWGGVCG